MSRFDVLSALPLGELLLILALLGTVVGLGRSLLPSSRRARRDLLADASASAVLDFTLVFPILTMVVLMLIQLALLINARLVVNYAAYAACRSAVVWLEQGESIAQEKAEQAAAVGCLPIAPGRPTLGGDVVAASAVAPLYRHSGIGDGGLARRIVRGGSKLTNARRLTRVDIDCPEGRLGPHDPVTVTVEHDFYLSVPYGDRLFRDASPGALGLPSHTLRDHYTLTHEGRVQSR